MQKFSRSLLLVGVVAFGALAAACGSDTIVPTTVTPTTTTPAAGGVTNVTVSPASATIQATTSITLVASVSADGTTAKTVAWTSSNSAVASVDATGKVTGVSAGTATIIATATADASKQSAAFITVIAGPTVTPSSISVNSVTDLALNQPVNLGNVNGQINVTVNTSGGGTIELFLSNNCTTNTISATDVVAVTSAQQAGPVTLSINTAQLTAANAPRFANGSYCIKARLTPIGVTAGGAGSVVATQTTALTLNNANVFRLASALSFASQTGRTPAAGSPAVVSTLNGLSYNEGVLTATITPVIFTGTQPAVISGFLTRLGEQSGGGTPGPAVFTNVAVTGGVATISFPDDATAASAATGRSIYQYTSLPVGDTLVITSAIDAAGNPVAVTPTNVPFAIANNIRIDNDVPTLPATTVINAPNGYLGSAYLFASGNSTAAGFAENDQRGAVPANPAANFAGGAVAGVGLAAGGTTYYVGTSGTAAFTTANSCDVTGLTPVTGASQLPNTPTTNGFDQAKVVVTDRLGNKTCRDIVTVNTPNLATPVQTTFGIDKLNPQTFSSTTQNNGVTNNTGYTVTKNFSFIYSDSISGFIANQPISGNLVRNNFQTPVAADCVLGTFNATNSTCEFANVTITSSFVPTSGTPALPTPGVSGGSIEFTNSSFVPAYYTFSGAAVDKAQNASALLTVKAAYDPTPPAITGAISQSAAVPAGCATGGLCGSVTISTGATDNLNLTTTRGNLRYASASTPNPIIFARTAGNALGSFGTFVTSGTATVTLTNVYRGLQSTTAAPPAACAAQCAGGAIQAGATAPQATITVVDVGGSTATSAVGLLTTTTTTPAQADILVGRNLTITSSAPTGAATASTNSATTNITVRIIGGTNDPVFNSQPFVQVDLYKRTESTGEYALVSSNTAASVTDDLSNNRTYTYTFSGVTLNLGPLNGNSVATGTNTFVAVGRNAAGDAVVSQIIQQINQ